jgi:hypothetical protein
MQQLKRAGSQASTEGPAEYFTGTKGPQWQGRRVDGARQRQRLSCRPAKRLIGATEFAVTDGALREVTTQDLVWLKALISDTLNEANVAVLIAPCFCFRRLAESIPRFPSV